MALNTNPLIIKATKGKRLLKEQSRFNKLVKQIEQLRSQTAATENNLQIARLVYNVTLQPLTNKWLSLKTKRLQVLDRLIETGGNKEIDPEQARQLLLKEAREMADKYNSDTAKELFDKYNKTSFGQLHRQSLNELMQMAKAFLDEMGMSSAATQPATDTDTKIRTQPEEIKTVSASQKAEKSASGLMKKIYLKLLQTYHPDKHPGSDKAEKITREANQAYQKQYFYDLLKLEKNHFYADKDYVDELPNAALKQYNEVLEEEVKTRNLQLAAAENKYGPDFYSKFGNGGSKLKTALENEKIMLTWRLQQLEYSWNNFGTAEQMKNYLLRYNYAFAEH